MQKFTAPIISNVFVFYVQIYLLIGFIYSSYITIRLRPRPIRARRMKIFFFALRICDFKKRKKRKKEKKKMICRNRTRHYINEKKNYSRQKMSMYSVRVLNVTFMNISVMSLWSALLVEETGVPRENHRPVASH
jgi:hypothetical protein